MESNNVVSFPEKQELNLVEAAQYLGVAPKTLRNWINDDEGPRHEKLFGRLRFLKVDLDAFLRQRTEVRRSFGR